MPFADQLTVARAVAVPIVVTDWLVKLYCAVPTSVGLKLRLRIALKDTGRIVSRAVVVPENVTSPY